MGEIIDFQAILAGHQREQRMEQVRSLGLAETLGLDYPDPETFGWKVVGQVDGTPTRYFHPEYKAHMGYVPGNPEDVYFDYRNETHRFAGLTLPELALGIETGTIEADQVVSS